jgi:hypothetical protein
MYLFVVRIFSLSFSAHNMGSQFTNIKSTLYIRHKHGQYQSRGQTKNTIRRQNENLLKYHKGNTLTVHTSSKFHVFAQIKHLMTLSVM